jgi:alpha-2-macroglobulin
VTYPDSLTTWRMTARAVTADTRLGATVARTTTTKDVIVRVATPRFLVEGDRADVPVVAHNYLPEARTVDLAVDKDGLAWTTPPPPAVRGEVASGGELLSSWSVTADRVGRASMTARAAAVPDEDAVQMTLPVLPFGLARERGTSGSAAPDQGSADRERSRLPSRRTRPRARCA